MESTPLTTPLKTTANPASFLMDRQKKQEPHAPTFLQALAQATQPFVSQTLNAESANLAKPAEPRSHLQLISLNPVQTHYVPEPAAFERIGESRLVPFTVGG
ncbi:hypothetical protein [Pseudomonas sp. W2-17]|uniref:hypothetical protein n=1 Tax=Pseudomonas sp. W2-17 TaxID=3058039 RepID=UPI0034E0DCB8